MSLDPAAVSSLLERIPTGIFIDGEFRESSSGKRFDVLNPATGEPLISVADATPEDAARALDSAAAAQKEWQFTSPHYRSEILRKAYELMVGKYRDDLALVMTLEMGKPLAQAYGEVTYGAEFFRWFAGEAVRIRGDYFRVPEGHLQAVVVRRPVGPCLFITPWNFPLAMATRKAGPAFAAGCTAIVKPSMETPLTALLWAQIMAEAGVPAGVLSVLPSSTSREITAPLIADTRLRKVSFTGSTVVGKAIVKEASENLLRMSMELGGNAPFIVFDDADIPAAVEAALATKMRNMGEACNAADHFFVHESVAEEFTKGFVEALSKEVVGNGLDDGVTVGPLISAKQRDSVAGMVEKAKSEGARALIGGEKPEGKGFFYPPTILVDVKPDSDIVTHEIFGPVAPVLTFRDEEELVALVNEDRVGLTGYVHTRDIGRIMRLAERIEVGMLGVNSGTISNAGAPFGGVKESGMGREGGKEGINDYLETVYVGMPVPKFLN